MDIESLLNPEGESPVLTETSDREIYQAVMDANTARENIEINSGDGINNETQSPTDLAQLTVMHSRQCQPFVGI
jgi:hypothetical protein